MATEQPLWLTFIVAFIFMNVLLIGMDFGKEINRAITERLGGRASDARRSA